MQSSTRRQGRIQIDLQVRDGHVEIVVRDEGLDAVAEQRMIFEKFYRVDAGT